MRHFILVLLIGLVVSGTSCGSSTSANVGDPSATLDMATSHNDSAAAPDGAEKEDLAPSPDLEPVPDLAARPDLAMPPCAMHAVGAGTTCNEITAWIQEWLDCHMACSSNNDCVTVSTHKGGFCKNPCPTIANSGAPGAYLMSLDAAFSARSCGNGGCACVMPGMPGCSTGMCVGL